MVLSAPVADVTTLLVAVLDAPSCSPKQLLTAPTFECPSLGAACTGYCLKVHLHFCRRLKDDGDGYGHSSTLARATALLRWIRRLGNNVATA